MSIIQGNALGGASAYTIANSVRFRSAASAYLSRTPSVSGNRKTWTWSGWVKRGTLDGAQVLFGAGTASSDYTQLFFNNSQLQFNVASGGGNRIIALTAAVFRDPSAWYHIQLAVDTLQAAGANGVRIWVNGVLQSLTISIYTQNQLTAANFPIAHMMGMLLSTGQLDGYLSEINFIDGQALDPSYFGEFSAETGAWIPKKYTGAYGTNGFYLPFNDGSNLTNLTADRSGNGNNWTANNFSLTSGVTYDWMDDTPTNNFAVLNPLDVSLNVATISNGNLTHTGVAGNSWSQSSVAINSGSYYVECLLGGGIGSGGYAVMIISGATYPFVYNGFDGAVIVNGTKVANVATSTTNDVLALAFNRDSATCALYKNNTLLYTATGLTVGDSTFGFFTGNAGTMNINFGQHPFAYTPPTGFKSLCTANLPTPMIPNPKQHFDIALATGTNIKTTSEAVFPSNFFEWIKDRANVNNHQLIDTVRGSSAVLQSNTTGAETTYSVPSGSSVGWVWKAGGAAVSNTAGSITSQVSANTTAGFSIVTYTGTGANATVGHGLGVAPKMVIVKSRDSVGGVVGWVVGHSSLTGGFIRYLTLHTTDQELGATSIWNDTSPTSSVFSVGTHIGTNYSAKTYVAYCFAEVPGFSKIGSYIGNGSSDGPFVYCGFKPRFVLIKRTDTTSHWRIIDTARSAYNANGGDLYPNLSNAEGAVAFDFLSNGIKPRVTDPDYNASGGTYIFYAVAESPFNYSTAR